MKASQDTRKGWFSEPVTIFRQTTSRRVWILIDLGAIFFLAMTAFLTVNVMGAFHPGETLLMALAATGALGALTIFYVTFRIVYNRLQFYAATVLVLSALAFLVEQFLLQSELFPAFTPRTPALLFIVFGALAVSLFYNRLPTFLVVPLPALLCAGVLVCIPFVVSMLVFMAFGWALIPFAGLGLLPYSPLLAVIAFALTALHVDRHLGATGARLVARSVAALLMLAMLGYLAWFFTEWRSISETVKSRTDATVGHNRTDLDLPRWAKLAAQLPANHVTELYLRTEFGNGRVFSIARLFDPASYLAARVLETTRVEEKDRNMLLKLLFGRKHVELDRLWSGRDLYTTNVQTHVQIFADARIAYMETTLSIRNESNSTREAIYTLKIPGGAAATRLGLWIDGKEEPARLALKSQARRAYRTIVGVERRDPALLEWLDSSRLRLRVFPIGAKNYRTVRFAVTAPLAALATQDGRVTLALPALEMEGPPARGAKHEILADLFSADKELKLRAENLSLKESLVSDEQIPQWRSTGTYRDDWKIILDAPSRIAGSFQVGADLYEVKPMELESRNISPQRIIVLLNSALGPDEWEALYRKLEESKPKGARVILADTEWFHSEKPEKMVQFIRRRPLHAFNLFPFYLLGGVEQTLVVTAGSPVSVNLTSMAGSPFYDKTRKHFSVSKETIHVASVNGRFDDYLSEFIDFARIQPMARSRTELLAALQSGRADFPRTSADSVALPRANVSITRTSGGRAKSMTSVAAGGAQNATTGGATTGGMKNVTTGGSAQNATTGGDLFARLYFHRLILRACGNRYFQSDADKSDLVQIARDGMIVSPVSSLVVLESERDYERFGITKGKSALGQSKIAAPSTKSVLGLVPEPEEWALIALVLLMLAWFSRDKLALLRARLPG